MLPFFKRRKKNIPNWSSFENKANFEQFKLEILNYFEHISAKINFEGGNIIISDKRESLADKIIILANTDKYCSTADPSEYETIIRKMFDTILIEEPENKTPNEINESLGIRILPSYIFDKMDKKGHVGFKITPDLYCYLVLDFPDKVINADKSQIDKLGKTTAELFDKGKENIKNKYPLTIEKFPNEDGIWIVSNEFFYAPNILLELNQYNELIGEFGALIAVPNGNCCLIHPIKDISVTDKIYRIAGIKNFFYHEKPNPVSPNLYWFKPNGDFIIVPFDLENTNFEHLPLEFLQMLKQISA